MLRQRLDRPWDEFGNPQVPSGVTARAEELRQYLSLVERVREVAAGALPEHAVVAVVSRGDDEMLRLDGPVGWHFPQTPNGTYAGFNPGTSDDAVRELEAVRQRGAQYLLVPATASWWLDHYRGLRRHVERHYRLLLHVEDTCTIYALGPWHPAGGRAAAPARTERGELIRQASELAEALLPPAATVAVVSGGEEDLVRLRGFRGWHLPHTALGVYTDHHRANSAKAVAQLEAVARLGAEYFLVPVFAFWWLDRYAGFRRYLARRARLVMRQRHVCALYELHPPERWSSNPLVRAWKQHRG